LVIVTCAAIFLFFGDMGIRLSGVCILQTPYSPPAQSRRLRAASSFLQGLRLVIFTGLLRFESPINRFLLILFGNSYLYGYFSFFWRYGDSAFGRLHPANSLQPVCAIPPPPCGVIIFARLAPCNFHRIASFRIPY